MSSRLKCKEWMPKLTPEEEKELNVIFDIIAVRVVEEKIGKKAPRDEPNWPRARICRYAGSLCMDHNIDTDTVIRYVSYVHEHREPVLRGSEYLHGHGLGKVLVKEFVRENASNLFSSQGRRSLRSVAKELRLDPVDLFGALAVVVHELADELATCCGEPGGGV